jgi:hypothetical protein
MALKYASYVFCQQSACLFADFWLQKSENYPQDSVIELPPNCAQSNHTNMGYNLEITFISTIITTYERNAEKTAEEFYSIIP